MKIDRTKKKTVYKIRRGLDIHLAGQAVEETQVLQSSTVAIMPADFRWITPKLTVQEGDTVKVGTPLFVSKTDERLCFVSPVSGTVQNIIRGEKRKIERIEISNDSRFQSEDVDIEGDLNRETIKAILLKYGLWTFVRQRPYAIIASPADTPKSIFISGFDSAPLAPNFRYLIQNQLAELQEGLKIISLLTDGTTFLCLNKNEDNVPFQSLQHVDIRYFSGPHPAGNIGTQIHYIDPINKGEKVWYLALQDVATIGKLFLHKKLDFSKTVALCGEGIKNPKYWRIITGSSVAEMVHDNLKDNVRIISGNVLTGKTIKKDGFIGFYDQQITSILEGGKRDFIGWLMPNFRKWSFSHTYIAWIAPKRNYKFRTSVYGDTRAFVMSDVYNRIFPFDILPLHLMKACIIKDIELMEQLGIYEVVEEDFALCDVVCPSKTECQKIIKEGLQLIANE